jgi:molybdopterin-guanine dinucleotide biosynthesis protein A
MGRDKAGLMVNGETLLNRQLRLLREAGATELLVITTAPADRSLALPAGARVIADRVAQAGPLAGIDSALSTASYPLALVLAVDLPEMTSAWLRHLVERCRDGQGVVPVVAGRFEPLAAAYPKALAAQVLSRLGRRELALQAFVQAGIAAGYLDAWEIGPENAGVLTNWNRPQDWLRR